MAGREKKEILLTQFLHEIGVITDLEDKKQCQNGIRWAKRNLNIGDSLVCLKRGVYTADEAKLKAAYKEHLKKCKTTSQKRRDVMAEVNKKKANKGQTVQNDDETTKNETPPPPAPPAQEGGDVDKNNDNLNKRGGKPKSGS